MLASLEMPIATIRIKQWSEAYIAFINLLDMSDNNLMGSIAYEHVGLAKKYDLRIY